MNIEELNQQSSKKDAVFTKGYASFLLGLVFSFLVISFSAQAQVQIIGNDQDCTPEYSARASNGGLLHQCDCNHACKFEITKDGGVYKINSNVHHTVGYGYSCADGWPDGTNDDPNHPESDEACYAMLPEILAILSPTHLSDPGVRLTCGNTHSYNAIFIPFPTPTPTPTPTSPPATPVVDAGGPYVNVPCVPGTTSVILSGSATSKVAGALALNWTTTCPQASFSSTSVLNPTLTFLGYDPSNKPVNCSVKLSATDSLQRTVFDTAEVAVGVCTADCKGVINGTAKTDACGVCAGDGSSCSCSSVDISDSQQAADSSAILQKNAVLQANKIIRDAKRKLSKDKLAKLDAKLAAYSAQAHKLYSENWTIAYSNPNVVLQCSAAVNCVSVSNVALESKYKENSAKLTAILVAQKKLLSTKSDKKAIAKLDKLLTKSKAIEKDVPSILGKIPDSRSSC